MRTFILLFLCFMVSACTTTAQFGRNSTQWKGRNVNDLVAELGAPKIKTQTRGGNTSYIYTTPAEPIYSDNQNQQLTTLIGPNGQTIAVNRPYVDMRPAPSLTMCITSYEVNTHGIIVAVRTRGNC